MNDFYQDLLSGKTTLQDVSDAELEILRECWLDGDVSCPTEEIFTNAKQEKVRRATERVGRARAKRKNKFTSDFFKE